MEFPPEEGLPGHTRALDQVLPIIHVQPLIVCVVSLLIGFFLFSPNSSLKTLAFGTSGVFFAQAVFRTRYERQAKSVTGIVFGMLILFVLATDLAKSKLIGSAVFMIFYGLTGLFGGIIVRKVKAWVRKNFNIPTLQE